MKKYFDNSGKILKKERYTSDNILKKKYYFDEKTGYLKEYISYNKNGKPSSHNWFDSSIETKELDAHVLAGYENPPSLLKHISYYDESGNIYQKLITHPKTGGKTFKYSVYEDNAKNTIRIREKFDKNGNKTFRANEFPGCNGMWFAYLYENNEPIATKMLNDGKWNYL